LQAAQALSGSQTNGGVDAGWSKEIPRPISFLSNVLLYFTGGKFNSNHNSNNGGANTVLRVIVEQMLYPVTLDVIYQIFSRVGKVLKIVTFTKNSTFQVLKLLCPKQLNFTFYQNLFFTIVSF